MCSHESFEIEDERNIFLLQIIVDSKYHILNIVAANLVACMMRECFAVVQYTTNLSKVIKYLKCQGIYIFDCVQDMIKYIIACLLYYFTHLIQQNCKKTHVYCLGL